jgi:hypothetical protein
LLKIEISGIITPRTSVLILGLERREREKERRRETGREGEREKKRKKKIIYADSMSSSTKSMFLRNSAVVPGHSERGPQDQATSATAGSLLEKQNSKLHSRPAEAKSEFNRISR